MADRTCYQRSRHAGEPPYPGAVRSTPPAAVRAAVLAGIVAVSVCSGGSSHRSTPTPSTAAGPTTGGPTTGPPATGAPHVAWATCPDHAGWQCGTLAVPLDHDRPSATIGLALTRHLASSPAARVGSLLVNPGGPGVSGVKFAYEIAATSLFDGLFKSFDVIGFDPRGVGASTPVHCVDGPALDRIGHLDPDPTTPAQIAAVVAGAKELAAGCETHSAALLPHVSTVDAARDMDDIRAAVGDKGINYLGFSYGTLLGATYASLFPTHIRALVLDSAIDPAVDPSAMTIAQAASFEQNLNAFLASCTSTCAFKAHGAPTLRAAFDALMARIKATPLAAGGSRTLGPGEALFGVADPLYSPTTWPQLAAALEQAEAGSGASLLSYYDDYTGRHADGTYDNSLEANTAINCLDHPGPTSTAGFQALAAQAAKQAPFFGPPVAWGSVSCLEWPVPPIGKVGPLHAPGAPPILVVGSTGDPATPYAWARSLASELGSGILVTRQGEGHGGYLASQCVRTAVDAYLLTLTDPPRSGLGCTS